MFFVYIPQSEKDKRTYVRFCKNLSVRLQEHNLGKTNATKNRRPFKILFTKQVGNLIEAKKRERYWKSGGGRRKLKQYFKDKLPFSHV